MDLRRLEVLVRVAELGSFSRAAEALSLSQPTVSEHVRALEDDLGVQLLDRLGRGATPTPAGRLLLGYARRVLALTREARQAVDQFQGKMTGALAVGGSTIPGEYLLPALVGRFTSRHPDVSISVRIGSSRHVAEWVDDGEVEVGVIGARPASRSLASRELLADELVVVVPADHPWARRGDVALSELKAETLVVRERGSGTRDALERALSDVGASLGALRIAGEMGSTQAVKQAVRAGVGVAVISRRAIADECRVGLLGCARLRDLPMARSFYLVTHRERTRSPIAEAFVGFVESEARGLASEGQP